MAGLDGQDGAGGGDVRRLGDGGCSSQVGGDTDAFEDAGERHEGRGIRVGEAVLELHGRLNVCGSEGGGEELDMDLLINVDLLEIHVEGVREAGLDEVFLGKFLKSALVEFALEVFKRQGVVEDDAVVDGGGLNNVVALFDGGGGGEACGEEGGGEGREIHYGL